jgi:molybdenum cofactor guanylyltransferase
MGTAKAALEWHGTTLLHRTVGIVARATGGPVVVVRASGQELPELPGTVTVVDDPREGKGPLQGIAAGLAALAGQADAAFVASTDLPFLHPAFIARVLRALDEPADPDAALSAVIRADPVLPDVALPVAGGYPQPLAAAYRTRLAGLAERLVSAGRLRPAFLFAECAVTRLSDADLLTDPALAALDPELDSVLNVNTRQEYSDARARPAPAVTVQLSGALVTACQLKPGPRRVRAATVRAAADAAGLPFGRHVTAALGGGRPARDPLAPLAAGDTVFFDVAGGAVPGGAVAGDKAGGSSLGDPQAAGRAMDHPICPGVT